MNFAHNLIFFSPFFKVGSARVGGDLLGASDVLVIHCHGGGFVAQTSKSHEVYLKRWAFSLEVPLLSIDYSHAPQAPFPRALEEVVYAYAWALKHSTTLLGSTAKKVIFIGKKTLFDRII